MRANNGLIVREYRHEVQNYNTKRHTLVQTTANSE